ncbi:MAG TPA: hypothetical protein VIT23_17395 [Terrimicrobiaceae bacterium]
MIRKATAIVLVGIFGILKMPGEKALDADQKQVQLRSSSLNLDLRERVGQMGFLAALSGFRSPLAAFLWIEAHTAWEHTEWGRMAGLLDAVTILQPRSLLYWDMASWHMAWNASAAALQDTSQPSEALRIRNQRQYFRLGRDYLERGIKNNPESFFLYRSLGILLRDKFEDHCGAGEAFLKAARLPGAPSYILRFAGYELAKCPGRDQIAYDVLKEAYGAEPDARKPTLLATIKELEKRLDVPESQRINSAGH